MVAVAPFSHRLAFHDIPDEIQRLRCKVNFEALRFVPSIDRLGNILVDRLKQDQDAKYLALHLRFDKVKLLHLSFSVCTVRIRCFSFGCSRITLGGLLTRILASVWQSLVINP